MAYRLGLVADIDPESNDLLKDAEYRFMFNYLRMHGEVVVFPWKGLKEDLQIPTYVYGDKEKIEIKKDGNLNEICDVLFIGQLGKFYDATKEFISFLSFLENFKGKTINKLGIIKDNLSKDYLLKLQEKGYPVVPTKEIETKTTLEEIKKLNFNFEEQDLVVKPKIFGEKGNGVKKISSFESEEEFSKYQEEHLPILVQPFIQSILEDGENSLIFVNNKYSHGLTKVTGHLLVNRKPGTPRICKKYSPSEEEINLSKELITLYGNEKGYCRLDFIPHKGKSYISEVEMINPGCSIESLGIMEEFSEKIRNLVEEIS